MKKLLLAAIAATGLLASCGDPLVQVGLGYYDSYQDSTTLTLGKLTNYQTNWQLSVAAQDQNGNTIAKDTYLICDNRDTTISFNLNWTGYLSNVGLQLKGYNSDQNYNVGVYSVNANSGSAPVQFTIGQGIAPLAINVTPVTKVTVKGYTYARAQGLDANGYASNVTTTDYSIPVVDCL